MGEFDGFESTYHLGKKLGYQEALLAIYKDMANVVANRGYVEGTYGHGYVVAYEEVLKYLEKRIEDNES